MLIGPRVLRNTWAVQEGQLLCNAGPAQKGSNTQCRMCKEPVSDSLTPTHYTQSVPGVLENDSVIIYWDQNLVTSNKLAHNKPDIAVVDKNENRMVLIEVTVTWYSRITTAEKLKYSRYAVNSEESQTNVWEGAQQGTIPVGRNLSTELQTDRGCRVDVAPIVIGTCGEVGKNIHKHLSLIGINGGPAEKLIERMCRSAILGTHRIVCAHLSN